MGGRHSCRIFTFFCSAECGNRLWGHESVQQWLCRRSGSDIPGACHPVGAGQKGKGKGRNFPVDFLEMQTEIFVFWQQI